jgi:hypothetical protein
MNLAASLFAPIFLLISAAGADEGQGDGSSDFEMSANAYPQAEMEPDAPAWPIGVLRSFAPETVAQVHIERRMTIRVAPRAATPIPREMSPSSPQRTAGPRFSERKIGKCLPMSGIAGVEPNGPNKLILFMRDRRMINAELDRSCLARSFYSGFYLSRSSDGMICVDRDTLLSRSGSACKLSRIRQLVEKED